ncbi:MAG: glycosyltransferase [Alphaproteobacteria bacterium]|nr:glycosyltransferase [Alphaproteobacteria bacterium]
MTLSVDNSSAEDSIDIAICTFRRPHIADTLRSIARMRIPSPWRIRIIVADNDEVTSAQSLVENTAAALNLPVTYVHAPARNISIARNACLDASAAPLLAFVDDDEIVSAEWLEQMLATWQTTKANIVLGPVEALYEANPPRWRRQGDFHATRPVWVEGCIQTGYSCNVLMERDVFAQSGLRFRKDLGKSGGEDTMFFAQAFDNGATIAFAEQAIITEAVPQSRASLMWLLKRRYRSGQTHGRLLIEKNPQTLGLIKKIKIILIAVIKWAYSYAMAVFTVFNGVKSRYWLLRGTLHLGVVASIMGASEIEQYGVSDV